MTASSSGLREPDRRSLLIARPRSGAAGAALDPVRLNSATSRWERVTGIEPALSAWEADVLPLNYTRERRQTAPQGRESRVACPDIVPEQVGCSRAAI
jgi:hypothetical protein